MTMCANLLSTRRSGGRRRARRKHRRRGASLVETAVTIMVFVTMILGMVDFGILVLRHHVLAQATRQLARQVIVHGDLSLDPWGPAAVNQNAAYAGADAAGKMCAIVRDNLVGIDPADVNIAVQWPDGGNSVQDDDTINVTTTAPFQPLLLFMFGNRTFPLRASSTMHVAH